MKFATSLACWIAAAATIGTEGAAAGESLREQVLRDAAKASGLVVAEATHVATDPLYVAAGKLIFQSKTLSLDHQTACATCHVDRFGSSDGLPNAVGTGGVGEGVERLIGGGDIIPRNVLPFWGRGGLGFDTLFWDGKVDKASGQVISQFGTLPPADDPLVVAVHLPPVEIDEMVNDSSKNEHLKTEEVKSAEKLYGTLVDRLVADEAIGAAIVTASGKDASAVRFIDVAAALASFIRENFKLQETTFHRFVFGAGSLTDQELAGGLLFYGKGQCSTCHNGPYFSDFKFHGVPFPQAGFGKNGFGIDYGRFNVTLDPEDRYKFRTPPLYNVTKTAPYSHSGSVMSLADAIRAHVDPLAVYDPRDFTDIQRASYYQALRVWSQEPLVGTSLDDSEIDALKAFLGTLDYESQETVKVTD